MASSLAMALGVSVASGAAQPVTCTSSSGAPAICVNNNTDISNSQLQITWNGLNGGSNNIYQPALNSGTVPISNLTLQFGTNGTSGNNNAQNFIGTINGATLNVVGNGKSIQMGSGSGTLTFDFNQTGKTANLALGSITTNTNYALYGNLSIKGSNTGTFAGTFGGKGIDGWLDIKSNGNHTITFENGAGVTGGISMDNGTNNVTFSGDTKTGKFWGFNGTNTFAFKGNATISSSQEVIYTGLFNNYKHGKNTFTFEGNTTTIESTYGAEGVAIWLNANQNSTTDNTFAKLTFIKGTNTITGKIIATSNYNTGNFVGKNTIIFESATTSNTINGRIEAYNGSQNEFNFNGTNSQNQINGNIIAEGGSNTFTFSGAGAVTLAGNIDAKASGTLIKGGNTFTFSSTGTNTITGNITATPWGTANGANTINFEAGTNIINGNIVTEVYGSGGTPTNTIKTETSSASLTINGSIIANAGGNNTLTLDVGNNTITAPTQTRETAYALNANGGTNTVFSRSGNSSITGNINASGTNTLNNSLNAITFSSTGTNTIAGNITASTFNAADGRSATGKNTFKFTAGTSTITGNISSIIGENTFAFSGSSTGTFSGNLENNAGTLKIDNTGSGAISINGVDTIIRTYGGGSANTTIQSVGALTINIKSIEVTNAGYGDNVNTIIAKNAGSNKITVSEGIKTSGGVTTNLAINGDSTNTTSSSLTANIINSGSTNIILQDSTWAPSALKKITTSQPDSGVLTNNSGVTNFVTRATGTISQNGSIPIYGVNALGGQTNIVMQGNASAVANINYGGGNATLIFASGSDSASDSFKSNATDISKNKVLGKTYENGIKLSLHDYNVAIQDTSKSLIDTFGDHFRNANGALLTLDVARTSSADTIKIDGLIAGDISSLADSQNNNKQYEVELASESAFVGTLGIESNNISLTMKNNSKLVLAGGKETAHAKLSTLNIKATNFDASQTMNPIFDQTNTVINLATGVNDVYNAPNREDFRLLEIGSKKSQAQNTGLVGDNALFQVYVNDHAGSSATLGGKTKTQWNSTNYGEQYSADRIVIHNAGDNSQASTHHLQIVYDAQTKIDNIKYTSGGTEVASNIAVATVVNKANGTSGTSGQASTNGVVNFALQNTLQGFDEIVSTLVGVYTDEYGKTSSNGNTNTYTTYFVNNARSAGASEANREATATAFGVNYDLYMANFNSLNKRMGELRDNPHSQGAWIRIFNGSQTNDMGLGTKSNYTTFQGGYDYAFGMEGANNYLGLAIAYGLSDSKIQSSMADLNGSQRGVENIKSNAVEVAVYNSYVQDEGWYNDTIAKFSYIFSDFNMMEQSQTYSTSNMAFTLSDEFGYRFKLGENKEWTIDPQLEVAYGYFDQSDFVQKLGVATLDSTLESITTLRTRVGSSFGYNFKNFTANKPIKASVYLGTFYEFDYISGGDITMTTNLGSTNSINSLSPDGRVVMNVGTNVEIYDNTRIYFDFESSFAGKIRTDYQVNIGARYSFGESNGYTPAVAKAKEVAPLKVEEVKDTQENQAQESKTTQESK